MSSLTSRQREVLDLFYSSKIMGGASYVCDSLGWDRYRSRDIRIMRGLLNGLVSLGHLEKVQHKFQGKTRNSYRLKCFRSEGTG